MGERSEVIDRLIDVGSLQLAVTESGVGGRPLLLVHGYTGARHDFADFVVPLAERGWHVVVPDLRGHGESSKPSSEADYSLELFADDLVGLADVLGWGGFVLLGHSMGGMVAQVLTLSHPGLVEALILMNTGPGLVPVDPALVELGMAAARDHGMEVIADLLATTADGPLTTEAHRRKVAEDASYAEQGDRNLRAVSPAMYAAMMQALTTAPDRSDRLRQVVAPTLVLVGEQDEPFRGPSQRMAEAVVGARLVVLPDGGHSPQFEVPEVWWAALSSFLDGLPAA